MTFLLSAVLPMAMPFADNLDEARRHHLDQRSCRVGYL